MVEMLSFVCYVVCVRRFVFGSLFTWCLFLLVTRCLVEVCVCRFAFVGLFGFCL